MSIVIVGAGMAGGRAAETLRAEGYGGSITVVGDEPFRPYERPPVSKQLLSGVYDEERVFLRPAEWYAEHAISLRLGVAAQRLDTDARRVVLADGSSIPFEKLLIATGSIARPLRVPGADLAGVLRLRTLADARALKARMRAGGHAVLVGAGFIGLEVAAACRGAGMEVTVLEALPEPLSHVFHEEVGAVLRRLHEGHGVRVRTGRGAAAFEGNGRVERVIDSAGEAHPCELVVVGVGSMPALDWLAGSGVGLDNGVLVDAFCQTSVAGVYAAGDVARWWHPLLGERVRIEHYDNAQDQGVAAALSMLGKGEPFQPVPYVWSDQYGITFQYVGRSGPRDSLVWRAGPDAPKWSVYFLRGDRLTACLAVGSFRELQAAKQLIAKRAPVEPAQLADEAFDLRAYARAAPSA